MSQPGRHCCYWTRVLAAYERDVLGVWRSTPRGAGES